MSAEALGWVVRYSPFSGATFLVHVMIGDTVNDQNRNEFWMTQKNLATKARLSDRWVRESLAKLCDDGYLELLEDNSRAGKPNKYRFLFPQAEVVYETRVGTSFLPGRNSAPKGAKPVPTGSEPTSYRTQENTTNTNERAEPCSPPCASGWLWDDEKNQSVPCRCNPLAGKKAS